MTNKYSLPFRSTLLTMATSNAIGGYECEFVESVSKDFECPLCLHVTREPHLTSCCGQHFCQSCINPILTDNKPCPLCKDQSFTTMLNKEKQRITLALKVYCTMKDQGCSWTGELGKLEDHLDTRNGSCQYVKVSCTNNCGKSLQRRFLLNHLQSVCPRRDFTCKYCGYSGTFEEVSGLHYLVVCSKYPLPCPNDCGIGTVERGSLEKHLSECPLQLVLCEFSHAGCSEKMPRKDITSHMKNNTQKHLDMTSATLRRVMKEKEEATKKTVETQQMLRLSEREKEEMLAEKDAEMQRKLAEKDTQMQRQLEKNTKIQRVLAEKEKEMQRKLAKDTGMGRKLAEKDKQIEQLQTKLLKLENVAARQFPPLEFTVDNYSQYEGKGRRWNQCPHFYTHLIGAKVRIVLFMSPPVDRVSIALCQVPGEFDEAIDWPVRCTVTVQILNQVEDKSHLQWSRDYELRRPIIRYRPGTCGDIAHRIPCSTLWPSRHDIQYVKNNCLRIRAKVVLK